MLMEAFVETMSKSSVAAAPPLVMSIPPALVSSTSASAPVPEEFRIKLASKAPVTATVRSSASSVAARLKFDGAPMASIEIAPPSVVSRRIPPVPASTCTDVASDP